VAVFVQAAVSAGFDEVIVVFDSAERAAQVVFEESEVTVLVDDARATDATSALRVGIDWCGRVGHEAVVVGWCFPKTDARVLMSEEAWCVLKSTTHSPIVLGTSSGSFSGLFRIDTSAWPLLPLSHAITTLWERHPEITTRISLDKTPPSESQRDIPPQRARVGDGDPSPQDLETVARLLGREPTGRFVVVVRDAIGGPIVIENAPFLGDGTPMPTRYWLVGKKEQEAVGRLESRGGARAAEATIGPDVIGASHDRYAAERDAMIPLDYRGPRPSGGVGGTRKGVKCLHAHLAWYLAGGGDPVGRWVAHELSDVLSGPVGAVDCGTNSTRLLVCDRAGVQVFRHATITRLGEGVDKNGALLGPAMARTLAALEEYRSILDDFGVVRVRAAATSAARDASNVEHFFDAAEAILGVRPELLEGTEEGWLSYKGATAELPESGGPYLICDLGGGSTELVAGGTHDASEPPEAVVSLDVGCVRITERFLIHDPPLQDELNVARAYVTSAIDAARRTHPGLCNPKKMIGVAGTISTLASLSLGLAEFDPEKIHHSVVERTTVHRLLDELASETSEKRRAHPGIEAGRADVIVGGALVLCVVMDEFDHDNLIYSERDILDGIAQDLLDKSG
jgi:exopolyphosphatase/guanosine-5'-triphosphate,3'-diphosphate pyrophosphatase